jgi:hypothetical protein
MVDTNSSDGRTSDAPISRINRMNQTREEKEFVGSSFKALSPRQRIQHERGQGLNVNDKREYASNRGLLLFSSLVLTLKAKTEEGACRQKSRSEIL